MHLINHPNRIEKKQCNIITKYTGDLMQISIYVNR